jgi:RNA polymerase sigma factor (sigma-70 family)
LAAPFPNTRLSLLERAKSPDQSERREAEDALIRAYWSPSYAYVRVRYRLDRERAEDLVQSFFTKTSATDFWSSFDRERAKFRTFLRLCLDRFVANDREARTRLKRAAELSASSLDDVDHLLADLESADAEEAFHRVWVMSIFDLAIAELERALSPSRSAQLEVFRALVLAPERDPSIDVRPSYQEVAARLGLTEAQVTNHLHRARKELRKILLRILREVTTSREELESVAPAFLGAPPYE